MTVYVDDMFMSKQLPGMRPAVWSHMTADTQAELHKFARSIGLRRSWFQGGPERKGRWHYDVTKTVRAKAVKAGAVEVTIAELVAICKTPGREGVTA